MSIFLEKREVIFMEKDVVVEEIRKDGLYVKNEVLLYQDIIEELNFVEKIFFKSKFIQVYKKGLKRGFNWNYNTVR